MSICNTRKDVVVKLETILKSNQDTKDKELQKIRSVIHENREYIEAALFTLNNCVNNSGLNYCIGNKLEINAYELRYVTNDIKSKLGVMGNFLENEHVTHKEFLHILNEITKEIYGEDYQYKFSYGDYCLSAQFTLKDLTIAEAFKHECLPVYKCLWFISLLLFPLTIFFQLFWFIDACFKYKLSLKCRS